MKRYPEEFHPFSGALLSDKEINTLIRAAVNGTGTEDELDEYRQSMSGNILIDVSLGYIHVYQMIAEERL